MSERERADEEPVAPSKAKATTDDVDSGWSDAPKPAEVAPLAEQVALPPGPAHPPVEAPALPAEPESPPVEPAAPPAEPAAPAEVKPPVEPTPPPSEVKPPVEPTPPPSEVKLFPVEPAAAWTEGKPLLGQPRLLASLWSARPNGAWMGIAAGAVVLAFVVGIVIGRASRPEPAPTVVKEERAPRPPAPPAPSAEPTKAVAPAQPVVSAPASPPSAASPGTKRAAPGPFNAQAAKLAIDRVVPRLKGCKQPGEPPGSATVTVTFAPTGRVSDARVTTTRYAGTRTGNCIAQRLHEARIPEFTGKPMTVKRGIAVR